MKKIKFLFGRIRCAMKGYHKIDVVTRRCLRCGKYRPSEYESLSNDR
ncbi:hypothetical protein Q7A53_18795 [Halobacillus rhizosphaerae]